MSDEFRFETFVDAHSNIFREYLSSLIAKLPESNEDYRAIQEQMDQANEILISDVEWNASSQALVDGARAVQEQGLQGLEAYLYLISAVSAQQEG